MLIDFQDHKHAKAHFAGRKPARRENWQKNVHWSETKNKMLTQLEQHEQQDITIDVAMEVFTGVQKDILTK